MFEGSRRGVERVSERSERALGLRAWGFKGTLEGAKALQKVCGCWGLFGFSRGMNFCFYGFVWFTGFAGLAGFIGFRESKQ